MIRNSNQKKENGMCENKREIALRERAIFLYMRLDYQFIVVFCLTFKLFIASDNVICDNK